MIQTHALARSFGSGKQTVEAVRGIDLDVAAGELVAFLGPNGAGKSTTLRMLTSLLPPTSGTARVAGRDVTTDPAAVRARIGYIGQKDGAGHNYRVWDELRMQGRFYGLDPDHDRPRHRLLESLDLDGLRMRKVSTLSGGQKRRLDLALGLIHAPGLLFLDEPSTGMDPQNRANLWEHIARLRAERGTTIVLTTHYLEEADSMAVFGARAALALGVFALVARVPLGFQLFGPLSQHSSPFDTAYYSVDLANYVQPTRLQALGGAAADRAFAGGLEEHTAYLGWPLLLLAAAVLVLGRRQARLRVPLLVALVTAVFALGPELTVLGVRTGLPLPWALLRGLPGFEHVIVTRFALFTAGLVGAALAFALHAAWHAAPVGPMLRIGGPVAAVLAVLPLLPAGLPGAPVPPVPAFFFSGTAAAALACPGGSALVLPFPRPGSPSRCAGSRPRGWRSPCPAATSSAPARPAAFTCTAPRPGPGCCSPRCTGTARPYRSPRSCAGTSPPTWPVGGRVPRCWARAGTRTRCVPRPPR